MKKISFEEAETIAKGYPIDKFLLDGGFRSEVVEKLNPLLLVDGKLDLKLGKMKGNKIPCKCPFHKTNNNDSTSLLLESNMIYCFTGGCPAGKTMIQGKMSKGINVISAYMILKLGVNYKLLFTSASGQEYKESVIKLAELQGFTVENRRRRLTSHEIIQLKATEVLQKTAQLYHEEFLRSEIAQRYFLEDELNEEVISNGKTLKLTKGRGFKYSSADVDELIKNDLIGYAPQPFPSTWLYDQLAKEFTTAEILAAGVVKMVTLNNVEKAIDFHSEALIIPYLTRGKVTNIYSRALFAEKKWRHLRLAGSVDEPINFDEGSRSEIVNICEGELSLESLKALSYFNSLGNRGTNGLKEEHVELLIKRREESAGVYCKTIYLIYDGDKPGKDAALNSGELLVEQGFDVRVVMLPEDIDPNDLLTKYKENAKSYFDKLYSEAVSYFTFVALYQLDKTKRTPAELLVQYKETKKTIEKYGLEDTIELMIIAKEFADLTKLPVEDIMKEWKPKENKQTEAFTNEKYAFITSDLENYYLTKSKFNSKVTFVQDTDFTFVDGEVSLNSLVMDCGSYTEEEQKNIKFFCDLNGVKLLKLHEFRDIYKMSSEEFIGKILKY